MDQLLGPIDNFDRAIVAQKTRADASEGVQKVVDQVHGSRGRGLRRGLQELGARRSTEKIDEVGVPFDPTIHEAAMTDFDENAEPDTVIKVFQYGVKVGDRLDPSRRRRREHVRRNMPSQFAAGSESDRRWWVDDVDVAQHAIAARRTNTPTPPARAFATSRRPTAS